MLVSYCTVCKGRLWQLQQVLMANLTRLQRIDAEWVIFDYHCPDQLFRKLSHLKMFRELFEQEKVKMYRLTEDIMFSMPLAKNMAHYYGTGDYLYSLDADNFIGASYEHMASLQPSEFSWVRSQQDNGTMGRIGASRKAFHEVGGYDLSLIGAGYEDIDYKDRLLRLGLTIKSEPDCVLPIQNTRDDTTANLDKSLTTAEYFEANRERWLKNRHDNVIKVNDTGLLMAEGRDLTDLIIRIEG